MHGFIYLNNSPKSLVSSQFCCLRHHTLCIICSCMVVDCDSCFSTYSPGVFSVSEHQYDHPVPDYLTESEYMTHPGVGSSSHGDIDSMTGDLDLPDVDDLDDDLEDCGDDGMDWFDDQKVTHQTRAWLHGHDLS